MPFKQGSEASGYRHYPCRVKYRTVSGKKQMPTSAGASEIVTLHAPYTQKIVSFEASRQGQWPVLPKPDPDTDVQVFLDGEIELELPVLLDGGEYLYWLTGFYVYGLKYPLMPGQGMDVGSLPFVTEAPAANAFGPENFSPNIVPPGQYQPGNASPAPQNASFGG